MQNEWINIYGNEIRTVANMLITIMMIIVVWNTNLGNNKITMMIVIMIAIILLMALRQ